MVKMLISKSILIYRSLSGLYSPFGRGNRAVQDNCLKTMVKLEKLSLYMNFVNLPFIQSKSDFYLIIAKLNVLLILICAIQLH